MSLFNVIRKATERKIQKGWPKLYWCIDLHNTIVPSSKDGIYTVKDVYPFAIDALRVLSDRDDMCIILFTSTADTNLSSILNVFKAERIKIDYINENPECLSNGHSDFSSKFYYDILIDDKAGFYVQDWLAIYRLVTQV